MSAVLEARLPIDPSAGLELVTGDEIALNATRHIFLAADLLSPARTAEIGMPQGGEELDSPCLRRTPGRLNRCNITPLEVWGIPMPLEQFPDGIRPMRIKGAEADEEALRSATGRHIGLGKPVYWLPTSPGEQIVDALGIASGQRRGIVEIKKLLGVDYGTYDREMQELFFGGFEIPIELRLIREHIEQVGNSHADPDVKDIASDMVRSCEESRSYMQARVDLGNSQLRTRIKHQWTYALTPVLRHFMAQLEVKPEGEDAMGALQNQVAQAVAGSGITPEQLQAILAGQAPIIAAAVAKAVTEAMAAKPTPTE
jgi:hypothetical protein